MHKAILEYVEKNLPSLPETYGWSIPDSVPCKFEWTEGETSLMDKNLSLKTRLHDAWLVGSPLERVRLCNWYIADWGGIHTNSEQNITFYSVGDEDEIMSRGITGIASWSKALTVRDPYRFAIFDARTSISLNAIQILNGVSAPVFFPKLPSRNGRVVAAQKVVASMARQQASAKIDNRSCYSTYRDMLAHIATSLGQGVSNQMVEMVLFSKADELSEALYTRKQ
ncbi:hypothetical protein OKW30_004664 [Paraburkholderia sp. Clong3]|uniref:hypothetical protein n=1 Tax=Paraburkholderia sp. Clong3 TaxID=2991061 RepID=UPI003D1CB1C8